MWVGTWQNQYGSTLTITDEADTSIRGWGNGADKVPVRPLEPARPA
ncbi:hypothetical protein [Catenulispora subtropica]|uniref:Uncharacterized protein n=1 Tax=Catenulispora subtropica TaxID=450798 RepID=A0ABN2RAC2_9ACTN